MSPEFSGLFFTFLYGGIAAIAVDLGRDVDGRFGARNGLPALIGPISKQRNETPRQGAQAGKRSENASTPVYLHCFHNQPGAANRSDFGGAYTGDHAWHCHVKLFRDFIPLH